MFRHMSVYYDLYGNKGLAGVPVESFTGDFTNDLTTGPSAMTEDISRRRLVANRNGMLNDKNADFSAKINNPHGHGYVAPLQEVRNQNAMEILEQQQSILAIGAIAGVSLIVFGILISIDKE